MKAFVTGGSGFIGRRVVEKLVQRGYQVTALVRSQRSAAQMASLKARPVWGDINASEALREAMRGHDIVFHLAGWYKFGYKNLRKAEIVNVEGTRNVLEQAFDLGIPRILYTSTLAVYGDTHGQTPDETYSPPPGALLTEYDRTKHLAHYHIALPLIERGAPIIILMPGIAYGPGDPSLIGQLMRLFYRGLLPIFPAPDMKLTFAYVDDIAEGHILAAEKGVPGQSYHLAGPAMSLREAIMIWAKVSGRRPPILYIPARMLKPLAPLVFALEQVVPLPELLSGEAVSMLDASYLGSAEKAQRELGWIARPPEEGFRQTFDAIAVSDRPLSAHLDWSNRRHIAFLALAAGLGVLTAWLFWKRKNG
jgi:nucleoside-diphosphate-sugar epimerase